MRVILNGMATSVPKSRSTTTIQHLRSHAVDIFYLIVLFPRMLFERSTFGSLEIYVPMVPMTELC